MPWKIVDLRWAKSVTYVAMTENEIREILLSTWDPIRIGENPHLFDEYDDYIPEIKQLLESKSASHKELQRLMVSFEKEKIGTSPDLRSIKKSITELFLLQ